MRRWDGRCAETLMRAAALAIVLTIGAGGTLARAQTPNINLIPEFQSKSPEEKERDAVADKAYRESLRKIPDKTVNDPWGDVRGAEAARAKPAAPKSTAPKAAQAKRPAQTTGATN